MSAPERPSLRRRVDHRLVAGVVGGVADRFNAPAGFLRVGLLYATIFTPWILAAYAGAALLMPPRGRDRPGWDNLVGLGRLGMLWAGPMLLGFEISNEGLFEDATELWVPLAGVQLVGLAVLLSRNYPRGPREQEARAAVLGALPLAAFAAFVALGVVLLPDFRWDRLVPVGTAIAGAALLAGASWGRARPFVAPAVVAAVAAAAVAGAEVRLEGGVGDRVVTATAGGDPPPPQHVAVGDLRVDLRRLRPGPRTVVVRASVGAGTLTVIVPRRSRVALDARVGRGTIWAGDHREEGLGARVVEPDARLYPLLHPQRPPPPLRVRVIARVGIGELSARRQEGER